MGKHALLSASSSKRWLSCTPSARLEEQFQDEPGGSVYAEEGTAAHALAEHKLKKALKRRSKRPVSDYHCDEMEECTDGYVAFAMEQVELAKQECKDPVVLIEQRLDYSAYVPEGFGTGDLLIVADKVLTVIDLKYGKGVAVEAERNPQMMLYGLGALELFDALYDIEIIRMTIYQPRLESVSTWEVSVKDLMEWVEMELKPKAVLAIKGEGEFHSGDWCRFCKAKNTCRARAEEYLRLAQMEFKAPPLLSDEEIAEVLKVADELAKWSADVYAYAQDEAVTKGKKWAGFKLVEGRSNRKYTDEEEVAQAAQKAGYTDIYKKTLIGITEMERLLGKKKFAEILGKQTTIWEFDRPKKSEQHPTMKPVGLVAYPIKNSSMSNCIVLDPFGGSGSTLVACEQTNRICYTIELDEKFADVIVNRYIEQAGSAENVFVERDGVKIPYSELTGEVKGNE